MNLRCFFCAGAALVNSVDYLCIFEFSEITGDGPDTMFVTCYFKTAVGIVIRYTIHSIHENTSVKYGRCDRMYNRVVVTKK